MTDERERIDVLREELDVELQAAETARGQVGPVTATDESGAIAVSLDADGVITTVTSDGAWRQHLESRDLPGAVLRAYTEAAAERQRQYVEATAEVEPARARPSGVATDPVTDHLTDKVAARLREQSDQLTPGLLMAMSELLDDLDRATDEAFGMVDAQVSAQVTGRSSSGHARATMSGAGELVSVDYDEHWLGHAHAFNVGRETTEAIHQAMRQQAEGSVDRVLGASGLARLQQMTTDPDAMARFLGV